MKKIQNKKPSEAHAGAQLTKWDIETIQDKRSYGGKVQYKIKWQGFPQSANTWESIEKLLEDGLIDMIKQF